jgi:hypothetical protein
MYLCTISFFPINQNNFLQWINKLIDYMNLRILVLSLPSSWLSLIVFRIWDGLMFHINI